MHQAPSFCRKRLKKPDLILFSGITSPINILINIINRFKTILKTLLAFNCASCVLIIQRLHHFLLGIAILNPAEVNEDANAAFLVKAIS